MGTLPADLAHSGVFPINGRLRLLGRNPKMVSLFQSIVHIAGAFAGVLIESESGTGKELVARSIHSYSARSTKPFIAINCAAINDSLLESELFGHLAGAFTGALSDKQGLVEQAHGGVLFLDEVSEMSLSMQAKLLRLLEEGEFRPVGATGARKVDLRLVAASNKDLGKLVREGAFRGDLYYRLKVVMIRIPPLRDRLDDLPLLTEAFLCDSAEKHRKQIPQLTPGALELLHRHSWPGNVRELKNCIDAMVVTDVDGIIDVNELGSYLGAPVSHTQAPSCRWNLVDSHRMKELQEMIQRHRGKKSAVARELGIARTTLDRRLKKYGLDFPQSLDT